MEQATSIVLARQETGVGTISEQQAPNTTGNQLPVRTEGKANQQDSDLLPNSGTRSRTTPRLSDTINLGTISVENRLKPSCKVQEGRRRINKLENLT
jgi:hypothetical protein